MEYFKITSLEDGNQIAFTQVGTPDAIELQYCTDLDQPWQPYTIGTQIELLKDSWVYFRNTSGTFSKDDSNYYTFTSTKKFNASGKIGTLIMGEPDPIIHRIADYAFCRLFLKCTTLVDASQLDINSDILGVKSCFEMFYGCTSLTQAPTIQATTLENSCCIAMFHTCHSLTQAPALPATTLATYCYNNMFQDCSSLSQAPELPATTLATYCYSGMFYGCTSLTQAPELPATTLESECYQWMFCNCSSLSQAPELPATTLATYCYRNMFENCTSLTQAPALPATTLAANCYSNMFSNCSSLSQAPELPATTLAANCYVYMFSNCTSLTQAPALPATTLENSCYEYMFYGCTSLTQAPELPAMVSPVRCYRNMFNGCTSLTDAPALPATTLNTYCYAEMFQNCTSLTQAPELPATKLYGECYRNMFNGCTSLTQAPALPATTLESSCYFNMFYGCTALTQAPALPATTLATYCYRNMFYGCTSLTRAPELQATTLASGCYQYMFYGCTNLDHIVWKSKTIPSSTYCGDWFANASASGTFEYTWPLLDVASIARNASGVPEGWNIQQLKPQAGISLKINNTYVKKAMLSGKNIAKLFINGVKVKSQAAIGTDIELPSQYTKLLYVDSNGGTIDTGIPTNGDLKVGIKWSKTKSGKSTWPELFGNKSIAGWHGDYYKAFTLMLNSNGAGTQFGAHYDFLHGLYSPTEQSYGCKVNIVESDPSLSDTVNEFWLSSTEFSWNGKVFNIVEYANLHSMREHNDWEYQPDRLDKSNMFLFTSKTGDREAIVNCYNFYIVDTSTNTVLVNYVPCKQGTQAGFYDTVTQAFVTNSKFLAGPEA